MEHLCEPMRISAFRAPTDNDRNMVCFWANKNVWQGENLDCAFTKTYQCTLYGNTIVVQNSLAGVSRTPVFRYEQRITFDAAGTAAAISKEFAKTDIKELQRRLMENQVVLHEKDL